MKIIVKDTAQSAAIVVAEILLRQIEKKPKSVIGLPTGSTPLAVYARLRDEFQNGRGQYKDAQTFNLDEYFGISAEDPSSYAFYMREKLFRHTDFAPENTYIPDGLAADAAAEAARYEALLAACGGIDLLFLGLGRNAHIGFNEPGSRHDSRTRRVALTAATLKANAKHFQQASKQPAHAITMGIGTILECREIVVLATGLEKVEAVAATVNGPVTHTVPGSVLARHPNTTIVLDREAAGALARSKTLEFEA